MQVDDAVVVLEQHRPGACQGVKRLPDGGAELRVRIKDLARR
ncbi:hypothetical protein SDC9_210881 [bioreactor metagenome]|uniref:Uncharacterized protein n=1 Tax=bioreactor metagenome TaxID=1076179 RepID=A0A645JIE5_9ZZZZ